MKKAVILFISALLSFNLLPFNLVSQNEPYYDAGYIRNDNAVYRETVRTVLLYREGFELAPPLIEFGSGEKLVLSFDDLDPQYKDYRYTVVHCDADWNTSDLRQMEYLEGYFEDFIEDYAYSFNTTIPYVNYTLVFPTDDLRLKKPGNYILKVFLDSDKDENIILTHRFMVYEPKVAVEGKTANSIDLDLRYTHQQLEFRLLAGDYNMSDVHRNLHVVILQNGRWDNAIRNIQPRNYSGNIYDFTLINGLVFPAGNEFRYFDMKTLRYNTDRMQLLQYDTDGYHVYLMTDLPRASGSYISDEDINGRRLIAANETRDPYSEGDYAWVHFLLPYWPPLASGNLYIAGAFSDWTYNRENLCIYNFDLKAYEAKILLKQGYYNYAYAFVANNTAVGDLTWVEGSFWETKNEYSILVYYREPGDTYDKLVGVGYVNRE